MPRKLTYEEVKKYINSKNCELLETNYINSSTKMKIRCSCGNIFVKDFNHFKRGQDTCPSCSLDRCKNKNKLSYKEVSEYISNHGCLLLSNDYNNNSEKLKIRCQCGNIFYKDFGHFKRGQNRCPKCGHEINTKKRIKYTLEVAKDILKERNYTIVNEDEYIDGHKKFKCRCSQGHEFITQISYIVNNDIGCPRCAIINNSGENHWNYQGGKSEVMDLLRKSIKKWHNDILRRDNYKCVFTGDKECVVHHIDSFSNIVKEASRITGVPILAKAEDYINKEDLEILINKVKEMHTDNTGVTISKKLHKEFHKIYGYGYNTREQYEEFISQF